MAETGTGVAKEQSVAQQLGGGLVRAFDADVGRSREDARRGRLRGLTFVLAPIAAFLWYRILSGRPLNFFQLPAMPDDPIIYLLPLLLILVLVVIVAMPLSSGRSPHIEFRPEQIEVSFDDVKGLDAIRDEVTKTLNTFLGYALYRDRLGGNPRRGLLFEGPPGTGKTHMAKAMAREAGVPFLFVSATSFQSMWYGATARKIRSFFRQLRRVARKEGGVIGFIEEIDAIGATRQGMRSVQQPLAPAWARSCSQANLAQSLGPAGLQVEPFGSMDGAGGVVNELLVQLQSFDTPPAGERVYNAVAGWLNSFLPAHRQFAKRKPGYTNLLVIAATNRADNLDPALLRPGRFDRKLSFELPAKAARRELIDYFLSLKAHGSELDRDDLREQLAGQTFGYTPVMIEHLLDEALVLALKYGRDELAWSDVAEARLVGEVGMANPAPYTAHERQVVATHEAGHATVAFLAGTRRLEILSIVKRSGSLGLLAHGDLDEVYTRSRSELHALIDIAMGGMCAEELYFDESGTGPSSDLATATQVACEIVGAAGMAGSLVSLAAVQNSPLNDSNLVGRVLADHETRPLIDELLGRSKVRVRALLDANRHILEALRDALLERDELIGEQIVAVCEAAGPPVRDGLQLERRADRRRRDWLQGA
jgi:ATP-dependent Zn protease